MKCLFPIEGTGGGAVTHALTLAEHLPEYGIEPVIAFFLDGPSVIQAQGLGLEYRLISWRSSFDFSLIRRLGRLIDEERIEIVHTHTITGSFYGHMACFLCSSRPLLFVTTVHSFIIDELKGSTGVSFKDWLRYRRDLFFRRFVDHFVVVSEKLGDTLKDQGVPHNRITFIGHGIDISKKGDSLRGDAIRSRHGISPDQILLGTVGRMVEVKNHRFFLLGAQKVLETLPEMVFVLVGDGPLRGSLERLAEELGIRDAVVFTGWTNQVEEYLVAFDIFVSCSITESQGLSILEAMSLEKAVVATDVDQISETVIDGETGVLVPPNDLEALARGIIRLGSDQNLRKALGKKARRLVEMRYSLQSMVKQTAALYEALRGENNSP